MADPKITGDYFRNIISVIQANIEMLELERIEHGRIMKFILGINRNLRTRNRQLDYYKNLLLQYIKDGRAI